MQVDAVGCAPGHSFERSMAEFTLGFRAGATGLDAYVPTILWGGETYSADIDRFLLALPLEGVRSPRSLRSYGYDLVLWVRFLFVVRRRTVLEASPDDIAAFHRVRRRGPVDERVSPATWNRSVSVLLRFYRWAQEQKLIQVNPITTRISRAIRGPRAGSPVRVLAMERGVGRTQEVRYLRIEEYLRFVTAGIRSQAGPGQRGGCRNSLRNALFADFLVSTGLRLQEASGILRHELPLHFGQTQDKQLWFTVPAGVAKGGVERRIFAPRNIVNSIRRYIEIERPRQVAHWQTQFERGKIDTSRALFVHAQPEGDRLRLVNGASFRSGELDAFERERLVLCDARGKPMEPAGIWLSERGGPVSSNAWEKVFVRASASAFPDRPAITPHQLRHTYAVHVLAMLLQLQRGDLMLQRIGLRGDFLLGDPLRTVQRLLGHASIETTFIYTDLAERDFGTIDLAAEELADLFMFDLR